MVALLPEDSDPVIRFCAIFLAATLSTGALAADRTPRARLSKAALVSEVNKDGDPILASSGVLVLDPATGHTLEPDGTRWGPRG